MKLKLHSIECYDTLMYVNLDTPASNYISICFGPASYGYFDVRNKKFQEIVGYKPGTTMPLQNAIEVIQRIFNEDDFLTIQKEIFKYL